MKKIVLLLIIHFFIFSAAQKYNPVDTVYTVLQQKQIKDFVAEKNANMSLLNFTSLKLSNKKIVKNFLSERRKIFDEMIKQNILFIDEESERYIQNLLNEIIIKNNLDVPSTKVFLSRETQPNAISLGSGIFIVNISMFCKINSDDEITFILSHELAHQILKHLEKSLVRNDNLQNSELYKVNLKTAKKKSQTVGIGAILEFLQHYQYDDKKNSRSQEIQADSLGFSYFKTLARDQSNAIESVKKLDSINPIELIKLEEDYYRKFFSTPNQKFNEDWLELYGNGDYNYSKSKQNALGFDADSLRTHPEIIERIRLLKDKSDISLQKKTSQENKHFLNLKNKMIKETLYAHYVLKEYGRGLYFTLQMEQKYPNDEFVIIMRGLFLEKLYQARKDHTYKRFVDDVDYNHQTKSYYQFLAILDHLSVSELQKLSSYYINN